MSRRRILRALALAALGATALTGVGLAGARPASAAPSADLSAQLKGGEYVALGDSYAAGYGLGHLTNEPVAGCGQSSDDYPHRVAEALDLELTDVTCAGATTADVVDTRQLGAAPQIDALSASTRLVTISIGGNDAGLFSTASSCIALSATGPIFGASSSTTNCRSEYVKGGRDTLARDIETTTATGLAKTFDAIRLRAPKAVVVVVGYPAVFPDRAHTPASGCYRAIVDPQSLADGFPKDSFPFTAIDVKYLASVQATLDTVTEKAVDEAGFTYVSTLAASEGRSGCATTGSYISGISLTATEYFRSISLATGALHPNQRGAAFLASSAQGGIERALAARASATASASASAAANAAGSASQRPPELVWIALVAALLAAFLAALVAFRSRSRAAARRSRDPRP